VVRENLINRLQQATVQGNGLIFHGAAVLSYPAIQFCDIFALLGA